jgi:transcriptional regulator with XRE-family HTH domain
VVLFFGTNFRLITQGSVRNMVRPFGCGQNWGSRGIRGRLVKNPVDLHIGQRVRHRRWLLGMTQQQLAHSVGIRFQQIQKYESGANRISASRLWDLAKALDMPISFFFEGLGTGKDGPGTDDGLLQNKETMDLIRAYYGLDEGPRRRLLELAKALSTTDLHK